MVLFCIYVYDINTYMTVVAQSVGQDLADLYSGFDIKDVGIGTSGTYANTNYAKKKTDKLLIGGLSNLLYIGFEHDKEPLALTMAHESAYNTVLAYNLHYVPLQTRQNIIKAVLQMNKARIQSNQPLIVDYHSLKSMIPESQYIVRRYKVTGTRVLSAIPLSDWDKAIRQRSGWENHWRLLKG